MSVRDSSDEDSVTEEEEHNQRNVLLEFLEFEGGMKIVLACHFALDIFIPWDVEF